MTDFMLHEFMNLFDRKIIKVKVIWFVYDMPV